MNAHWRLRSLLAVQVVSRTGNVATTIAVPFVVLSRGGSATDVGIAAFAATVPIVLGGAFGGVLVERFGFVRSSVASDLVSAVTLLAIPLLAWTVGLPSWALLALVFLGGLFDTPGESGRRVLLPGLADAAGIPLERAVGHFEASVRFSVLLGAPAAGLLVGAVGPLPALAVTAAVFTAAALLAVLTLRGATVAPATEDTPVEPSAGYWRDLGAGLRFCARDPLFRLVIALVLVTNLLDAARSTALLPLYADRLLDGAQSLGIVSGTFGGAAFLGSLAFGYVAHRVPRRITFVVCFALAVGRRSSCRPSGSGCRGCSARAWCPGSPRARSTRSSVPWSWSGSRRRCARGSSGCCRPARGRGSRSADCSAASRRTASG